MNERTSVILLASIIVVALFLVIMVAMKNQKPIGGERDTYGCLISAGYSWNDSVAACLREWELDESQKQAVKIATLPLSYRVTVIEVETLRCTGCFNITLQRNDNQNLFHVELVDWKHKFDCTDYPYSNCPESCVVCPPCEFCSSMSCQTEEFCESLGFDRSWYEGIKERLNGSEN